MFHYEVEYWNELNQEPSADCGMVSGDNYGEAANRLVDYYGEKNIVAISLSELTSVMSEEEILDEFKNN